MMWSKGAVVVVKHGDEAIADAIEKGLDIQRQESCPNDVENRYGVMKHANSARIQAMIDEANLLYGRNPVPPKWAKRLVEWLAFIVYGFSTFIDRYLIIK